MKALLLSLLLAASAFGADPVEIRLPEVEAVAPPKPGPVAVTKLSSNQLYIIDSTVELQVVASRDGLVKVTAEAGPLRIKGVFVDNPSGKPTTRMFKGPFLYSVEVVATGQVELLIFKDVKTPAIRRTIDVEAGVGPLPPPKPPEPKPPVPVTSFRALIIRESGATYTAKQIGVMDGKAVGEFLNANCTMDDGRASWRRYDKDQDASEESPVMKALWVAVKPKLTGMPCLAIEVNGQAEIIPLPATPEEAVATLAKYKAGK